MINSKGVRETWMKKTNASKRYISGYSLHPHPHPIPRPRLGEGARIGGGEKVPSDQRPWKVVGEVMFLDGFNAAGALWGPSATSLCILKASEMPRGLCTFGRAMGIL